MLLKHLPLLASILAVSLLLHPVVALTWATLNTTSVSYTEFLTILGPDRIPFIGPKGFYTVSSILPDRRETLAYVDAMPGSTFSQEHPAEFQDFVTSAAKLQPLGVDFLPDLRSQDRESICGMICANSETGYTQVCLTCSCKFYAQRCTEVFGCVQEWACQ